MAGNKRIKPNPLELFPQNEESTQMESEENIVGKQCGKAAPAIPKTTNESSKGNTPNKKQSFSAFLSEFFQSENPQRFRQMNQLAKDLSSSYTETDIIFALQHYYKYTEEKANIADWCGWDSVDKMIATIVRWKEFERVKAINTTAIENKQIRTMVYQKKKIKNKGEMK